MRHVHGRHSFAQDDFKAERKPVRIVIVGEQIAQRLLDAQISTDMNVQFKTQSAAINFLSLQ